MYKRLFWSGLWARYHQVTWRSDEWNGAIPTDLSYQYNGRNAFGTAQHLAAYAGNLGGEVVFAAHSLGNMLVSSAIQDHSATPGKYFMLNAAVAAEAYDMTVSADTWNMAHVEWTSATYADAPSGYSPRLWASEWYVLFPTNDFRWDLSWRDRFANARTLAVNMYSPGDQILEVKHATPALISVGTIVNWELDRYAWWKQELLKGRCGIPWGSSTYGGWEFACYPLYHNIIGDLDNDAEMAAVPNAALRTDPFFRSGKIGAFSPANISGLYNAAVGPGSIGSTYALTHHSQLLMEMIPALSQPAGTRTIPGMSGNLDLQTPTFQNGWPAARGQDTRWLHNDYRDVAYVYVWNMFEQIVIQGGLK